MSILGRQVLNVINAQELHQIVLYRLVLVIMGHLKRFLRSILQFGMVATNEESLGR